MKKQIVTAVLLVVVFVSLFIGKDALMKVSFDAKYFASSSKTMKYRMALDIVNIKRFIGSPIGMVRANLGKPDHTAPDSISYSINEPLGWRDTLTLNIRDGLVSDIYIHD